MAMRSNSFAIPGNPSIQVSLLEQDDGTILVNLSQSGSNVADIQGLFFDVTDSSILNHLLISGNQVTKVVLGNEAVTQVDGDVNMNGAGVSPFDVGIAFGTSGIGKDDIRSTSFVLSSQTGSPLTLDLLANVDFGARLTSVGGLGSSRNNSLKTVAVSTAAPNAIDDRLTTNEDNSNTGNLLNNDTDANAGDLLSVVEVNGATASVGSQITLASGALLTVNSNGSYTYNPNGKYEYLAVGESTQDHFNYRVFDGVAGYDTATATITITGVNDSPIAARDSANTNEDTAVNINVLANDTDIDATDVLSVFSIVDAPDHGTVIINSDKTLTYTPNTNYNGSDKLTYQISDGNGGFSNAVVDLTVAAKADTPSLTVDVLAGDSINQVKLRIRSSLTDTDGSERLDYVVEGIPSGVAISGATSGSGPNVDQYITLTLPKNSDSNFNLVVKATSTEASNGDQAVATVTQPIVYDANFNDFTRTFAASNQSMWDSGNAFTFTDSRFLGINDSFDVGFDAFFYGNYKTTVKAGLQSDLSLRGGEIDASLPYNIDLNTFYNKASNTLLINPTASLLSGGQFTTDSPGGSYKLDFIFNLSGTAQGGLNWGELGRTEFFNTSYSTNQTINLIDFNTDTNPSLSVNLPYGLSGTLAFPNIDTTSSPSGTGRFTASGTSNNFLTLNLDVDTALATIFLGGVNPFDLNASGGITGASGSISLELLDLDVSAGINFLQNFVLDANGLDVTVNFENNTSQTLTFGQDFLLNNASSYDANGDGLIAFSANLTPRASITNNTNLGFNLGYNFDLLKGSYSYELLGIGGGDSFGPVLDLGETFPIASVPVYTNTFGLNFGSQSLSLVA
jgi:VCBS repeat-containing protein